MKQAYFLSLQEFAQLLIEEKVRLLPEDIKTLLSSEAKTAGEKLSEDSLSSKKIETILTELGNIDSIILWDLLFRRLTIKQTTKAMCELANNPQFGEKLGAKGMLSADSNNTTPIQLKNILEFMIQCRNTQNQREQELTSNVSLQKHSQNEVSLELINRSI
ncbi:MAG: hypothetical protein DRP78_07140 [Candidatus Omnitrophota bacterium]|nr:MAG: hypothetical protein DRP78_07140 [Candidatus Omnitrophota bacterium]